MGDISGIILTFLLGLIIFFSSKLKKDPDSYQVIILGFLVHLIIAMYNGFVGPTIGAGIDPLVFYHDGAMIARSGDINLALGSNSYRNILGALYYVLGPSMYLACVISLAAYTASLFPLIDICSRLKLEKFQKHILAAYSFLPSMFLFGSVALRESLEICFFIFAVSYFIKFYANHKFPNFLIALVFSALMGALHFGLMLFSVAMIFIVTALNYNRPKKWFIFSKSKLFSCVLLGLGGLLVISYLPSLDNLGVVSEVIKGENIAEYAETRRNLNIDQEARSGYNQNIDLSSPFNLIVSIFSLLIYYLAYPFPWTVSSAIDIYASLEAIWRCLLIYYSFVGWRTATGEIKKILKVLIILYFTIAVIWATGTADFGNGIRHNTTHYWILTITGLPFLVLSWRRYYQKIISGIYGL